MNSAATRSSSPADQCSARSIAVCCSASRTDAPTEYRAGDLQQLARLLYRAYMSPQRHEIATAADDQPCSNSQDGALIGSATAAEILGLSRRSVQRLAATDGSLLGAVRCGSVWLLDRSAVQALASARERKKAS